MNPADVLKLPASFTVLFHISPIRFHGVVLQILAKFLQEVLWRSEHKHQLFWPRSLRRPSNLLPFIGFREIGLISLRHGYLFCILRSLSVSEWSLEKDWNWGAIGDQSGDRRVILRDWRKSNAACFWVINLLEIIIIVSAIIVICRFPVDCKVSADFFITSNVIFSFEGGKLPWVLLYGGGGGQYKASNCNHAYFSGSGVETFGSP